MAPTKCKNLLYTATHKNKNNNENLDFITLDTADWRRDAWTMIVARTQNLKHEPTLVQYRICYVGNKKLTPNSFVY